MALSPAKPCEDRLHRGIAMILAAYLVFSFIDVSAKWLVLLGLPAIQLAFMRYAGHFAISLALSAPGGLSQHRLGLDLIGLVLLRATCLILATVANFSALKYLPITTAAAILYASPLIVTALSVVLLGERAGAMRLASVLMGFTGVLVVMRPEGGICVATLIPLASAVCFALYVILTRRLAGAVAPATMQFYSGVTGTAVLLPVAVVVWDRPPGPEAWVLLLALGLWGWGGHEIFARAHRYAEACALVPYTNVFLLYVAAGGFLAFGTVPDAATVTGACVIVASGLLLWLRERRACLPPPLSAARLGT